MARCANSWPRRGSCRLNFAHVFRILSDLLGVLVSVLLWVGALGAETCSKAPCLWLENLPEGPQSFWAAILEQVGLGCVHRVRWGSMPNKWPLPGSEMIVLWVTSCFMNGKGHVTVVASIPVLIQCYCWQFDVFLLNLKAVSAWLTHTMRKTVAFELLVPYSLDRS